MARRCWHLRYPRAGVGNAPLLTWPAPFFLGATAFLVACTGGGSSDDVPTRVPPADPVARFEELAKLEQAASFHVIYQLDTNYDVGEDEFAWLQDAGRVRWDDVSSNDRLSGESTIDDGTGSGISCIWITMADNTAADVICSPGPGGWDFQRDRALNDYFRYPGLVEFRGYRSVLEIEVECFGITIANMTGRICLSAEGVPLEVEAVVGLASDSTKYFFRAVEIRPPPTEAELLTPIIPDVPLRKEPELRFPDILTVTPTPSASALGDAQRWEGIALAELVLPDMPIVEEFLSHASQ